MKRGRPSKANSAKGLGRVYDVMLHGESAGLFAELVNNPECYGAMGFARQCVAEIQKGNADFFTEIATMIDRVNGKIEEPRDREGCAVFAAALELTKEGRKCTAASIGTKVKAGGIAPTDRGIRRICKRIGVELNTMQPLAAHIEAQQQEEARRAEVKRAVTRGHQDGLAETLQREISKCFRRV